MPSSTHCIVYVDVTAQFAQHGIGSRCPSSTRLSTRISPELNVSRGGVQHVNMVLLVNPAPFYFLPPELRKRMGPPDHFGAGWQGLEPLPAISEWSESLGRLSRPLVLEIASELRAALVRARAAFGLEVGGAIHLSDRPASCPGLSA
jgi:hypothetical protein